MPDPKAPVDFNMPLPTVPFTRPDNTITPPWLFAILGLWARTGGSPAIPAYLLQAEINALAVEQAMSDVNLPTSQAFGASIAAAMTDNAAMGINPLMAALMLSPTHAPLPAPAYGTTAHRPVTTDIGSAYFDTTLGFEIWWSGSGWVDASGAPA